MSERWKVQATAVTTVSEIATTIPARTTFRSLCAAGGLSIPQTLADRTGRCSEPGWLRSGESCTEEDVMTAAPVITGWAHGQFGKLEAPDVETLLAGVTVSALEHAEVEADDVDGVFVGVFNAGFSAQGF